MVTLLGITGACAVVKTAVHGTQFLQSLPKKIKNEQ